MEVSDTENIIAWRNNPRVRHNFIYKKLFTRETHLQWIKNIVNKNVKNIKKRLNFYYYDDTISRRR